MAIFRGTGGAGEANDDATLNAVTEQALDAATSASEAASSATAAATSATAAASSASSASTSATSASNSASSASTSATSASTSATTATNEANYAEEWATKAEDSLISTAAGGDGSTDYSSLHHAAKAATSSTAASTSASAASTSATAAAASATAAAGSASSASTSATAAASSATAAASSATAAATSESAAATSETNAASSATAAATSETNAQSAQTAAESARDAALAAYDSFDDRYLGVKTADPTLDNDGNALVAGSLYFNSTVQYMKLYTGSAWVAAYATLSGLDTDDLSEGTTNLYYTDARAQAVSINNVVEDTTPQLGGTLDANGQIIDMGTNTITDTKVGQWDTAYGWGNHASAGYLTSYTETDPVYTASSWYTTTNNSTNWNTAYGWGDHSTAGYLTSITGQSIESLNDVNTMTPSDGQLLTWDNANSRWDAADAPVSLPSQTSHSGEFLTTDGTTASWTAISTGTSTEHGWENAATITTDYTITTNYNMMSAGPISITTGSVTVPSGSTWTIV